MLFLGLGTGATASGAVWHQELHQIEIAELIPEVATAARMFAETNGAFLDDPRVKIHIDDARHHLLTAFGNYDVIISDLFVPWESETGYISIPLTTTIWLGRKLAPGGIFCQWARLVATGTTRVRDDRR